MNTALQSQPRSAAAQQHAAQQEEPRACSAAPQNMSEMERYLSMLGGAALVIAGISVGRGKGLLAGGLGGALLYRGFTGHCHGYEALGIDTSEHAPATAVPAQQGVKIEKTIAINRPAEEIYALWADLERLPSIMQHLVSVKKLDDKRSHWVAKSSIGKTLEWDAEIHNQRENELIAWRSLPGSEVETAGSVHFTPLGSHRGTAVKVSLKYNPPAGKLAAGLASWFGMGLEHDLAEDLRRFKSQLEAGEVPTNG